MQFLESFIESVAKRFNTLWEQAMEIWLGGGWAMIVIACIALLMFGMGMHIRTRLRSKGFLSVSEDTWRRWIDHPNERKGPVGELLDFVADGESVEEVGVFFDQYRTTETIPFERDLRVMKICVSAAPLVGLLGTVTGMLATFDALATGAGGDKTMSLVAGGISEALITTETGLVIALPGLFMQYQLARNYERYKAFLAHLETIVTQKLYRKLSREREHRLESAARVVIARKLEERAEKRRALQRT